MFEGGERKFEGFTSSTLFPPLSPNFVFIRDPFHSDRPKTTYPPATLSASELGARSEMFALSGGNSAEDCASFRTHPFPLLFAERYPGICFVWLGAKFSEEQKRSRSTQIISCQIGRGELYGTTVCA